MNTPVWFNYLNFRRTGLRTRPFANFRRTGLRTRLLNVDSLFTGRVRSPVLLKLGHEAKHLSLASH